MERAHRRFSLEEANALLPHLQSMIAVLFAKKEEHERMHDHLLMQELLDQAGVPGDESARHEIAVDDFAAELAETLRRIRSLGCILKDWQQGEIDFLATQDESEVLLCWKHGEKEIAHYHPLHNGRGPRARLEGRLFS